MHLFITALLFLFGLVLIVKGGDWFVDAATWMARVTGIPNFIIGATVVSIATTLPELLVSLVAAAQGKVDMAVGNAVGSVTANTGLILGISLIFLPGMMKRKELIPKALLLIASCAGLWWLCSAGGVSMPLGLVLFVILGLYFAENIRSGKSNAQQQKGERPQKAEAGKNILLFVVGAAAIVVGANLLVNNGSELARLFGVPEKIIALTFVAIGTSLPELVTTITAIAKKQGSLSVGNIIGANIIDLTLILPLCGVVSGGTLPVSAQTYLLDLPVALILTLIAMLPAMITGKFRRWQGAVLVAGYAAYLLVLVL
ncbi:MAG: calcium/sodium antiporter [Oscillospiraceae bacterium]|nr:calcium/sodium antiporter [Oscillospiraceae bacterium]